MNCYALIIFFDNTSSVLTRRTLMTKRAPVANINTPSYSGLAKFFHWSTAALVLGNLAIGLRMEQFPGFKHGSPDWNSLIFIHASIGALIFWLTVSRFGWRLMKGVPPFVEHMPSWQKAIADLVHGVLYAILLVLPIIGYLHRLAGAHDVSFFGLFNWPIIIGGNEQFRLLTGTVHIVLAFTLLALIVLHVSAAIKHAIIDRDGTLGRMMWPSDTLE